MKLDLTRLALDPLSEWKSTEPEMALAMIDLALRKGTSLVGFAAQLETEHYAKVDLYSPINNKTVGVGSRRTRRRLSKEYVIGKAITCSAGEAQTRSQVTLLF
jgi:hypothetical protein